MSAQATPAAIRDIAHERGAEFGSPPDAISFYVLNCLQNLRDLIREWGGGTADDPQSGEIEEICWAVRGLAIAARTTGFNAYGCICLHLAELIEDLHRGGSVSGTLQLLGEWAEQSERYLRYPSEPAAAMTLIAQLNHPQWGSQFCQFEQDVLSRALLNPFS